MDHSAAEESDPTALPPPPPLPSPAPASVESASATDEGRASRWIKALGGLGWLLTFVVIYSFTHLVLRLGLEAIGVETTPTGATSGDEKNPPGQVVGILGALAIGLLATLLLRRWSRSGTTDCSSDAGEPLPLRFVESER